MNKYVVCLSNQSCLKQHQLETAISSIDITSDEVFWGSPVNSLQVTCQTLSLLILWFLPSYAFQEFDLTNRLEYKQNQTGFLDRTYANDSNYTKL